MTLMMHDSHLSPFENFDLKSAGLGKPHKQYIVSLQAKCIQNGSEMCGSCCFLGFGQPLG